MSSSTRIGPPKSKGRRLSTADNEVAAAIAEIAVARWGLGSAKRAEAQLRHALELEPDHLEGLNILAQVCAQTSRHTEGFALLERAVTATAKEPANLALLGNALAETYEARKDYRRAKAVYERCLEAFEAASLYNGLGYCLGKLGDLEGAIRSGEAAARLAPERPDFLNDWAWSLIEAGRPADALPLLERAVAMDPAYELARENLEHCQGLLSGPTGRPRQIPPTRPPARTRKRTAPL